MSCVKDLLRHSTYSFVKGGLPAGEPVVPGPGMKLPCSSLSYHALYVGRILGQNMAI